MSMFYVVVCVMVLGQRAGGWGITCGSGMGREVQLHACTAVPSTDIWNPAAPNAIVTVSRS